MKVCMRCQEIAACRPVARKGPRRAQEDEDGRYKYKDDKHEDKDDEQNVRVVLERRRVLSSIMRKECLVFELAHHHHKGLD